MTSNRWLLVFFLSAAIASILSSGYFVYQAHQSAQRIDAMVKTHPAMLTK